MEGEGEKERKGKGEKGNGRKKKGLEEGRRNGRGEENKV